MEFATRHHIRRHYPEDPVYYQTLSERLEEILQTFADNWEAQVEALRELIRSYQTRRLRPSREDRALRPFLRLVNQVGGRQPQPAVSGNARAGRATVSWWIRSALRSAASTSGARPRSPGASCAAQLLRYLDDHDLVPFEEQEAMADDSWHGARPITRC